MQRRSVNLSTADTDADAAADAAAAEDAAEDAEEYSSRHTIQMFPDVCAQSLHEPCFEASVAGALWMTVQLPDLE